MRCETDARAHQVNEAGNEERGFISSHCEMGVEMPPQNAPDSETPETHVPKARL